MVILLIAGDFLAMSLTTDNVEPSPQPNIWHIGGLSKAGVIMGLCLLTLCVGVLATGTFALRLPLPLPALPTLCFVVLVFCSHAMIYGLRGRPYLWSTRPSV